MPVVSEKQRRAMQAAKHGRSTLGIPKSVAEEFLAKDAAGATGHAAGIVHVAPDGSILLLHRSPDEQNYAGHWSLPGGKADDDETPEECAIRECSEEIGHTPESPLKLLDQKMTPNGMAFHTFATASPKFAPRLNGEHTGFTWARLDMLPQPLHPSVEKMLDEKVGGDGQKLAEWAGSDDIAQDGIHAACGGAGCAGCGGSGLSPVNNWPMKPGLGAMDEAFAAVLSEVRAQFNPALAFDRAPEGLERHGIVVKLALDRDTGQGQETDAFERLHAKRVPITKAGVNPYYGREIPKGRELGLDPSRVYRLLRHPDEIKKAAATFHNLPLLDKHVPHSVDDHDGDITVGTVGSEAEYDHPYLYNSLAIWNRQGRDHIDSGSQKELSSAYSYDADMTPGTYEGEPYDGVMRNMVGNHVCLVKKGRVGSDVALDEALKPLSIEEILSMSKKQQLQSLKATVAYGALTAFLKPKLAMDAQINLHGALATFEPKKFKASTPDFVAALKKSLKGKLAQDGDLVGVIEGVEKLMASIDGDKTVEDGAVTDDPDADVGGTEDDTTMDGGTEAIAAYLKSKGVPDDVIAGMPGNKPPAEDSDDIEGETPEMKAARLAKQGAKDGLEPDAGKGKDKPDFVSKGAMDAALKEVERSTIARMNEVAEAKAHVKPIVGELSMAFDSAEGVYRQAFKMQDRDVSKIKGSGAVEALRQMWDMIPNQNSRTVRPAIAQDSETVDDFAKTFPNMAKVRRA
jgi:8-oxo-dGTP pyrophosphatase MutT (NUDIX family)